MNLLTWNIQAGIGTARYRDYLLHAHRQVIQTFFQDGGLHNIARGDRPLRRGLPAGSRSRRPARRLSSPSRRNRLTIRARPCRRHNRTGPFPEYRATAMQSSAIGRWPKFGHETPRPDRGRGCRLRDVSVPFRRGWPAYNLKPLVLRTRRFNLAAVAGALRHARAWVAMGDFNCGVRSAPLEAFCEMSGGKLPQSAPKTFPSWRPRCDDDHIVCGGQLSLTHYRSEAATFSDDLPVSASIAVG